MYDNRQDAPDREWPSRRPVRRVSKPWGHEIIFAHTDRYVEKIFHINAGESQYHELKEDTLLEAIRELQIRPRIYQASSSEMFGKVQETPQKHGACILRARVRRGSTSHGKARASMRKGSRSGACRVEIDPRSIRPTEVDLLLGDATKARAILGWRSVTDFRQLVQLMTSDLELAAAEEYAKRRSARPYG
jgi:GDP-D-mannose dehydratase